MNKKYQIFISSTYQDLKQERAAIFERIIEFEQIPAGMEFFPLSETDPLQHMKKIIDKSDYYILIVGGRYGSTDKDGVSYTEKEFHYAQEQGIPLLIFLHENIKNLPVSKVETIIKQKEKLLAFRQELENSFTCHYWSTQQELESAVIVNLSKAISEDTRPSWEKISLLPDEQLVKQIQQLTDELENLNQQNKYYREKLAGFVKTSDFNFAEEHLLLHGLVKHNTSTEKELWNTKVTWKELFLSWAPYLLGWTDKNTALKALNQTITDAKEDTIYNLNKDLFHDIKVKLWHCGLIKINPSSGFIRLSLVGEQYLRDSLK